MEMHKSPRKAQGQSTRLNRATISGKWKHAELVRSTLRVLNHPRIPVQTCHAAWQSRHQWTTQGHHHHQPTTHAPKSPSQPLSTHSLISLPPSLPSLPSGQLGSRGVCKRQLNSRHAGLRCLFALSAAATSSIALHQLSTTIWNELHRCLIAIEHLCTSPTPRLNLSQATTTSRDHSSAH